MRALYLATPLALALLASAAPARAGYTSAPGTSGISANPADLASCWGVGPTGWLQAQCWGHTWVAPLLVPTMVGNRSYDVTASMVGLLPGDYACLQAFATDAYGTLVSSTTRTCPAPTQPLPVGTIIVPTNGAATMTFTGYPTQASGNLGGFGGFIALTNVRWGF